MSKSGPIVIIEDDADDRAFLEKIFVDLKIENTRIWFENAEEAMVHLMETPLSTFIIVCDINLPGQNGLDFKKTVDSDPYLRKKSIPFIFHSTTATQQVVNQAYSEMNVQGFFKKKGTYESTKTFIITAFDYWKLCIHPNM